MHHISYMVKSAAITVRIPPRLRKQLEARARREKRSVSAQVEYELERALRSEAPDNDRGVPSSGRFAGCKLPSDEDIQEVRAMLWGRLSGDV